MPGQKFAAFDRVLKNRHSLSNDEHKINSAWTLHKRAGGLYALYHYQTCMLMWQDHQIEGLFAPNSVVIETNLGHSSVSDQQGMNRAFEVLGVPYNYSRKGGHGEISYTG